MEFKAKPIHIHKIPHESACASIILARGKTTMQRCLLEGKTKQAVARVESQEVVESMVAKQNIIAGYGKERVN